MEDIRPYRTDEETDAQRILRDDEFRHDQDGPDGDDEVPFHIPRD